jgi:hypothetical protein
MFIEYASSGIGRITLGGNAFVPVVIRVGAVLNFHSL